MKCLTSFLCFLALSPALFGQDVLFNKTEDFTPQFETFWGQIKTPSNELVNIIAKSSNIPDMEYDSTMLVSYDEFGCELWSKTYYFHEFLVEGVFIENEIKQNLTTVAFYRDDAGMYPMSMIGIIEFTYEGELLNFSTQGWEATNDTPLSAKVLPDGGLVIAGRRTLGIGLGPRGFVVRTDVEGNLLWDFTYGDVAVEGLGSVFTDVQLGLDGNFWVIGDFGEILPETLLLKLNGNGEIVEEQFNLFPLFLEGSDVAPTHIHFLNDGTYLIAATNFQYNAIEHTVLASFTIEGDLNWLYYAEPFFQVQDDRTEDMEVLPNGDILLCGYEREIENDLPIYIGWIKKFSPLGELLWDINYTPLDESGQEFYDAKLFDLDLMDDGSIWAGGSANYAIPASTYANTKVWMMRIDTSGNFITDLSASLSQENEINCVEEPINVGLEVLSTNGCYETEWLVNDSLIISENKDTLLFSPMASGTYEVICNLIDDLGQSLSISKQIEIDNLSPLVLPSTDTLATQEIIDLGEIPYFDLSEWMGEGVEYLYEEDGRLYFANAPLGEYELILISGCLGQQFMTIVVDTETSIVTLANVDVSCYPNPATTSVTFEFELENRTETLFLYNSLGQLTKEIKLEPTSKRKTISTAHFVSGIYYWQIGQASGKLSVY